MLTSFLSRKRTRNTFMRDKRCSLQAVSALIASVSLVTRQQSLACTPGTHTSREFIYIVPCFANISYKLLMADARTRSGCVGVKGE